DAVLEERLLDSIAERLHMGQRSLALLGRDDPITDHAVEQSVIDGGVHLRKVRTAGGGAAGTRSEKRSSIDDSSPPPSLPLVINFKRRTNLPQWREDSAAAPW